MSAEPFRSASCRAGFHGDGCGAADECACVCHRVKLVGNLHNAPVCPSDDTPVLHDPKGHSFEPFDRISNAAAGASCRHCGREAPEHPAVKCHTHTCSDAAAVRAYWPGQTCDFCAACAVRAAAIADAMGFKLDVSPLPTAAPL